MYEIFFQVEFKQNNFYRKYLICINWSEANFLLVILSNAIYILTQAIIIVKLEGEYLETVKSEQV